MAPKYWTESVRSDGSKPIFTSRNYLNPGLTNSMGLYTNLNLGGSWYLETNLRPPYSQG